MNPSRHTTQMPTIDQMFWSVEKLILMNRMDIFATTIKGEAK